MVNYPADWEVKKLGDIGKWESGSTPSRNKPEYYKNGRIFWVKNTDLNDGVLNSTEERITEIALKENFLRIKKPGTILIAMYCGETVGKLSILNVPATTNQNCCACELYDEFDNRFIFYSLLYRRKEIQNLSLVGGLSHISKSIITNYSIPLPPLSEQHAIANTLAVFDNHINNLSELIAKKKAIRDGALNDLMTGRTRLKGFCSAWEVVKFDDIFHILSNNTLSRDKLTTRGNIGNIHYGDVLIKYTEILTSKDDIPRIKSEYEFSAKKFLRKNDIIIADTAEDNTVGKATQIGDIDIPLVAGLHTIPCRPIISTAPGYLGYYINSKVYHNQLLPYITGIKVSSISKSSIKNTKIFLPPLTEQQAIADTLTAFDNEILALESERDKIIQIRDGAMNDLLTGKVRLC